MTDLEKAIRILEGNYKSYVLRHNGELLTVNELIALLKAQQPRVTTLEELKSCSQETMWFEEKPNHTIIQLTQDGIIALVFLGLLHNWNGYGTIWRCWTSRPTDVQREAEPWAES